MEIFIYIDSSSRSRGSLIPWLTEVRHSSSKFVNLISCAKVCLVSFPEIDFCITGLHFFPSASWPLSSLFLRPCLIHARMPERSRAFVHGHTFLHSWSGPMKLVVDLLREATCSCPILRAPSTTAIFNRNRDVQPDRGCDCC